MDPEEPRATRHRFDRAPFSRGEEVAWYAVAALTYIGASLLQKGLLNWLIGPLWLVAVITFGPLVLDRLRRRQE